MNLKKIHLLPKTKLSRISAYISIIAFALIYIQYWLAMIYNLTILFPGFLIMVILIICGITSLFSIIKYKDYSILSIISSLLGLLGILFVIGEFLFPH